MQLIRLHQQYKYYRFLNRIMFAKTDFHPSKPYFIQLHKGFLSPKRKKRCLITGKIKNHSKNNWSLPSTCHLSLSMMDLHSQQEHLTMVTSVQELLKMLFVDMHHKPDTMFHVGLDGTAMGSQSNIKLTKLLRSLIKDKSSKWELINITSSADPLSWDILHNGNM